MKPLCVHVGAARDGRTFVESLAGEPLALARRRFPDGETWMRVERDVAGRDVVVLADLAPPDAELTALLLLAGALREQGAACIGLAVPYLPYMRQDRAFAPGEPVSARLVAGWLGRAFDFLVTVEPHLHRVHRLEELYAVPTAALPAAPMLAEWLCGRNEGTFVVGPDEESAAWAGAVAQGAGVPWVVLAKQRLSDHEVRITVPDLKGFEGRRPVLVDDIVSTGRTAAETARQLTARGFQAPALLVVHPIFAAGAESALLQSGIGEIVSCNTRIHPSNGIDVLPALARASGEILARKLHS